MRFVLCGDQLIVTSGAVEDVAQEGGPWVLCSRSLSLVPGIALAGVCGPPSDGWTMGLLAASGLRVATFPASNMPTHHVPALRPHVCFTHWLPPGLSWTEGCTEPMQHQPVG